MGDGPGGTSEDPEGEFTEQARSAGLTLPTRKRLNLWDVAAVTGVILLVSVGIGVATGWMNPRVSSGLPPGLLTPQSCSQEGDQHISVNGTVASDADPLVASSLGIVSNQFTSAYGGCVTFTYGTSGQDGGLGTMADLESDFAVVEAPPTSTELALLPGPVSTIPLGLTAVSIAYDLPGVANGLNLSGSLLEQIYAGAVTSWNDPAIAQLNPGVSLPPSLGISVAYRSDSSALNFAFTGFLAKANSSWNTSVGQGLQVTWPVGTGVGSSGSMVSWLAGTPGAIGYVETGTSLPNGIGTAKLENSGDEFVAPDQNSLIAAATGAANSTPAGHNWTDLSPLDASGSSAYPLTFLSYAVVYSNLSAAYGGSLSLLSAEWELTYLWWVATDGGYLTASVGFVPLPSTVVTVTQVVLGKIIFDGKSVLEGSEGGESGGETGEF